MSDPRHRLYWSIAAAISGAALSACSETAGLERRTNEVRQQPAADDAAAQPQAARVPADPAQSATTGGDGSPIRLSPLTSSEIEAAQLEGELGCGFAGADDSMLLVAMGDVASNEPSFGVVKVGDHAEPISAPGGFDGMLKDVTFVGKGKSIRVVTTASVPVGGGESPPYPARLTYQRADGASRSFDGLWICGP